MLKSDFDEICVSDIEVLDKASLNVKKIFKLYNELSAVLDFLSETKFSYYFQERTNISTAQYSYIIKNSILKYINSLNYDLNSFMEKVGSFNFKERNDKLNFKEIDIKNHTYLSFLTSEQFSRQDKFLCLSCYFTFKIDGIKSSLKEIHMGWHDKQFVEYAKRVNTALNLSLKHFPKIFKDYSTYLKIKTEEKKK